MKVFSSLLCLSALPAVVAYPNGAGGCAGGTAAVGGFHLQTTGGRIIGTGSLARGNLVATITNDATGALFELADPQTEPAVLTIGQSYTLTVNGAQAYRGFLYRFEGLPFVITDSSVTTDPSVATTGEFTISETITSQQTANICTFPVEGITHTNSDFKNGEQIKLSLENLGQVSLDITIVDANNATESIYWYTGYILEAEAAPVAPTAPTASPPTAPPTGSDPYCSVCSDPEASITKPDAMITSSVTGETQTCAEWQADGATGNIPDSECKRLKNTNESEENRGGGCGCEVLVATPTVGEGAPTSGTMHVAAYLGSIGAMAMALLAWKL